MDTRVPHFDGQKDFLAFLRFLDNRKEFEAYIKQLDTKIAAFVKAVAVYGKAKDIENLHHDAELVAVRAESAFAEREKHLEAGETALAKDRAEAAATWEKYGREAETSHQEATQANEATAEALKLREAEVGKRENAIMAREKRAQEAQAAAEGAKKGSDDMVARMKAAASPEKEHANGSV